MALHPSEGFTGTDVPQQMISAESGEMQIRFTSDSLESSRGFSAVFSADCPDLVPGKGKRLEMIPEDFKDRYLVLLRIDLSQW